MIEATSMYFLEEVSFCLYLVWQLACKMEAVLKKSFNAEF